MYRVLSLFSGIGGFELALSALGINYQLVGFAEIDPYAIKSYCAIHQVNESLNLGDVSQASYHQGMADLIVGGSPCQDFSLSGKQKGARWTCLTCHQTYNPLSVVVESRANCPYCGGNELDKTRSSLVVEYLRAIREVLPTYFVYENVPNIAKGQHKGLFELFIQELKDYGYQVDFQVLNAKDYGIPQQRERLFVVGQRMSESVQSFQFPLPQPLTLRLKDVLEETPTTITPLSLVAQQRLKQQVAQYDEKKWQQLSSLTHTPSLCALGNVSSYRKSQAGRVVSEDGISMTICRGSHGYAMGYVGVFPPHQLSDDPKTFVPFVEARAFTSKEAWRLMGIQDEYYERTKEAGISHTQLYMLAGNAVVVNVLMAIFKVLL